MKWLDKLRRSVLSRKLASKNLEKCAKGWAYSCCLLPYQPNQLTKLCHSFAKPSNCLSIFLTGKHYNGVTGLKYVMEFKNAVRSGFHPTCSFFVPKNVQNFKKKIVIQYGSLLIWLVLAWLPPSEVISHIIVNPLASIAANTMHKVEQFSTLEDKCA